MAEYILAEYGRAKTINFHLVEVDGVDYRIDASDGGTDCSISKDEGADTTCTNDFADEGIGYSLVLTATEMTAARILGHLIDSATKQWLDTGFYIETYGHASSAHPNLGGIVTNGAVNDGAATTTDFDTDGFTEASNDHFNDNIIKFTSGNLRGQSRPIYKYTGSGQNMAFDRPWTETPGNNDEFVILPTGGNIDVWLQRAATIEANATVLNARGVYWGQAKLFNKIAAAGGTLTIYEDDDTTGLFTQSLTTDAGADPITIADTN